MAKNESTPFECPFCLFSTEVFPCSKCGYELTTKELLRIVSSRTPHENRALFEKWRTIQVEVKRIEPSISWFGRMKRFIAQSWSAFTLVLVVTFFALLVSIPAVVASEHPIVGAVAG